MSTMSDEIKFRKPIKELYPNMEPGQVSLSEIWACQSERLEMQLKNKKSSDLQAQFHLCCNCRDLKHLEHYLRLMCAIEYHNHNLLIYQRLLDGMVDISTWQPPSLHGWNILLQMFLHSVLMYWHFKYKTAK